MAKKATEIVVILDRSGSMGGFESDTIGGFNSFVKQQKELDGEAYLTLILFDDKYDVVYQNENIQDVLELTNKTYFVRGSTALLDAMGKAINSFVPKKRSNVIFLTTTDGQENASREYTGQQVRELVEKKKKSKWEFLFVGANIDSFGVGGSMGLSRNMTSNYTQSHEGTQSVYNAMNVAVSNYRDSGVVQDSWTKDIK